MTKASLLICIDWEKMSPNSKLLDNKHYNTCQSNYMKFALSKENSEIMMV